MTSISATEARKSLYKLVDEVRSHEPVQITGKRGNAVLVGEEDWRAVQESSSSIMSIPGMRDSMVGDGPLPQLGSQTRFRLVSWRLVYTKAAQKDAKLCVPPPEGQGPDTSRHHPDRSRYQSPPPFDLSRFERRILSAYQTSSTGC